MKAIKLIMCLLLLSSNIFEAYACSYYPYGEDIRFSLFSPNISKEMDVEVLFYNAAYLNQYSQKELRGPNENIDEWYEYLGAKFDRSTIDELIYRSQFDKFDPKIEENEFYQFLKEEKKVKLKEYLYFAKQIEYLLYTDYWDKKKSEDIANMKLALEIAEKRSRSSKDEWLKLRYAYQGVVLAYYLGDNDRLTSIFDNKIAPLNSKSVIVNWALFYKANYLSDKYEKYRLWAKIFEESRAKNEYIFKHFPTEETEIKKILAKCKTNEEKAAVYGILAFKNPARAFDEIEKMLELNPKTSLLNLLLVREINKMEDWYYTDRYTGYGRSVNDDRWWDHENDSRFHFIDAENFENDKLYLNKIKDWAANMLVGKNITNKGLWCTSLAYMSFMLDDPAGVKFYTNKAEKYESDGVIKAELRTIDLLSYVKFNPVVDEEYQEALFQKLIEVRKYKDELYNFERFSGQIMLALSRKFLEDKNVVMAALFEAKVAGTNEKYEDWQSNVYQGFNLLNENAKPADMESFFKFWNKKEKTKLEQFLFEGMEPFKWRFTDLWATSYLREDRLEEALAIYKTIPDSVWEVTNHKYHYYYHQELNANPFETRFTTSAMQEDRSVSYTKPEFVAELIRLKNEVKENPKKKAYNYMLLGNAYYNMTYEGNSWYYTEYAWSANESYGYGEYKFGENQRENNPEYYHGGRAEAYYKLAEESSKSDEFSAFCYRLQFKCLALRSNYETLEKAGLNYQKKFKSKYPKYYEDLRGCDRFSYYFGKWKNA